MLIALRIRSFALLWTAGLVSQLGDWCLYIALPFHVYNVTGSPAATGLMFMVETLPSLLFGAAAGVFVDRWDRRRTMVVSDFGRCFILLILLGARTRQTIWLVYVAAFAESTLSQFFRPAKGALTPRLVGEDRLLAANSANSLVDNLTTVLGPSMGGALMAAIGLAGVVVGDCVSYFLSGALILMIPAHYGEPTREVPAAGGFGPGAMWRDWIAGLRAARSRPTISALFALIAVWMLAQGIVNAMLVVFVKDVLRGGARELGWVAASQGVGGLLGGLLIARVSGAVSPSRMIVFCAPAVGLLFLLVVNAPSLPLALALMAPVGMTALGCSIGAQTMLQLGVTDEFRGRILGALGTTTAVSLLAGMALAAALGRPLGVTALMDLVGVLFLLSGALAAWRLPSSAAAG